MLTVIISMLKYPCFLSNLDWNFLLNPIFWKIDDLTWKFQQLLHIKHLTWWIAMPSSVIKTNYEHKAQSVLEKMIKSCHYCSLQSSPVRPQCVAWPWPGSRCPPYWSSGSTTAAETGRAWSARSCFLFCSWCLPWAWAPLRATWGTILSWSLALHFTNPDQATLSSGQIPLQKIQGSTGRGVQSKQG